MTVRDYLEAWLTNQGLWPAEAVEVAIEMQLEMAIGPLSNSWDGPLDDCPVRIAGLQRMARRGAASWLRRNRPGHVAIATLED